MSDRWRRIVRWLRRWRRRIPAVLHVQHPPKSWTRYDHFPHDGITGPPRTRSDVTPTFKTPPLTLRDRRSSGSR